MCVLQSAPRVSRVGVCVRETQRACVSNRKIEREKERKREREREKEREKKKKREGERVCVLQSCVAVHTPGLS